MPVVITRPPGDASFVIATRPAEEPEEAISSMTIVPGLSGTRHEQARLTGKPRSIHLRSNDAMLLTLQLLAALSTSLLAQAPVPGVTLANTEQRTITSTAIGQQYDLWFRSPRATRRRARPIRCCTSWTAGTSL